MRRSLTAWQWALDVALALAFTVLGQLQLAIPNDDGYYAGPAALNVAITALTTGSLALRRVFPVPVAALIFGTHVAVSLVVPHSVSFWGTVLPMAIAMYSAARWGALERRVSLLAMPAAFVVAYGIHMPEYRFWDEILFTAMLMGAAWGAGRVINELGRQRSSLTDALTKLAEHEEEHRRQVLLQERTSIAREMHDIVAHGVSVMVVQAGATRMDLDTDPDAARQSLLIVERTGRDVLAELRRTVSLLRNANDRSPDGQPSPSLAGVPDLVEAMRRTGLDVDLHLDVQQPLDQGRGLAVYRVVQESLTNVLRHADNHGVSVCITDQPELTIEVVDRGPARRPGRASTSRSPGHGLVGMRERVAMYNGSFRAGPTDDGFIVRATLPQPTVSS